MSTKPPTKRPAGLKLRALRDKLEALALQGVNGERDAAKVKLERLLGRYDFSKPMLRTKDLFAGVFHRASVAVPVCAINDDTEIANAIKWAIEQATKVPCLYREGCLWAEATPATVEKLKGIAATVGEGFNRLWDQFARVPGVNRADRALFLRGVWDGMMQEEKPDGEPLPQRAFVPVKHRAKKRSVAHAPGLQFHPYSIAVPLGRQIRFGVSLDKITGDLADTITKQIEQPTTERPTP